MNKADSEEPKEMAKKQKALEKASGGKVFVISAVAKQGIFDCLREVNKYITRDRTKKENEEVKTTVIVEDKPWSPV